MSEQGLQQTKNWQVRSMASTQATSPIGVRLLPDRPPIATAMADRIVVRSPNAEIRAAPIAPPDPIGGRGAENAVVRKKKKDGESE